MSPTNSLYKTKVTRDCCRITTKKKKVVTHHHDIIGERCSQLSSNNLVYNKKQDTETPYSNIANFTSHATIPLHPHFTSALVGRVTGCWVWMSARLPARLYLCTHVRARLFWSDTINSGWQVAKSGHKSKCTLSFSPFNPRATRGKMAPSCPVKSWASPLPKQPMHTLSKKHSVALFGLQQGQE